MKTIIAITLLVAGMAGAQDSILLKRDLATNAPFTTTKESGRPANGKVQKAQRKDSQTYLRGLPCR